MVNKNGSQISNKSQENPSTQRQRTSQTQGTTRGNNQNRSSYRGNSSRQNNYNNNYSYSTRQKRIKEDETVEDIREDICRIEKEIQLELREIRSMRLGL